MTAVELLLTHCVYSPDQHPRRSWDKYVYDDENIHYAILQILFEASARFTAQFLQIDALSAAPKVTVKPAAGIFDMLIRARAENYYLEVKVWSLLQPWQFDRQTQFLRNDNGKGRYLLFTKAADKWSADDIAARSNGLSQLVTMAGLEHALADLETDLPREAAEVADAYRVALEHLGKRW